jgi:DNA modification methylase
MVKLVQGDCRVVMGEMADTSVDSLVCDPPYGISFMGKKWDYDVPGVEVWRECLRVLKPGGHILVACGTRTQHRMCVNIEDGGFEIRDLVAWVYGSGFPKSLNVGKSIDKKQGTERKVVGYGKPMKSLGVMHDDEWESDCEYKETKGTSEFEGWGTALKPAMELWTLARKPLGEKNIAEN